MEVRPGYKQTEGGVIPESWEFRKLTSVAQLESGHTPSRRQPSYWGGQIAWVSLHDTDALGEREIYRTAKSVTQEGIDNSSARVLPKGTVVFSRTATVGKSTVLGRDMATSQDFANYICGPEVHNHYLVYLFRHMAPEWRKLMAGSTHNTVYMPAFRTLRVVLPPRSEQEAIAEALGDADALIESLERLLAKKRQLKQGTMQELLTGKRRLPGFEGKWEEETFGDVFHFQVTATNSRSDLSDNGDAYYVHYGDIHTRFHSHLDFLIDQPPRIELRKCPNATALKNGDWLMADASEDLDGVGKTVEILGLDQTDAAVSGLHTFLLREKRPTFAPGFKGHLGNLKSMHNEFLRVATGMKVFGVSKAALRDLLIPVPPKSEQTAIASILFDLDDELRALEAELSKARVIKQGMMQELLTGRIRLV